MRILHFCWEYPPRGSGIGRYVEEMSSALRQIGHETVVVTSKASGCPEKEEVEFGVIYRIFDFSELRTKRVAERVLEIATKHNVDWIEGADHWGECAPLLRLRNRPPVVIKMHYNDVLKVPRYGQAWYSWQKHMIDLACIRQWRSIRAEQYSIEHADILLAPCHRIFEEAERQGLKLPRCRVVTPNPIGKITGYTNQEADLPTLLLVGRLDMGKGIAYLPDLLRRLVPEFPRLRIEIAGGDNYARGLGSMRSWLEKQLGSMIQHVCFLGLLDRVALDDAYRRAWAVIVPSRWDTFPQVVLESMIRSKAIVASPHGGMPEMLSGTDCTISDPSTDMFSVAIADFMRNSARRKQAGESACRYAETAYAPAHVAQSYIKFVSSSLSS